MGELKELGKMKYIGVYIHKYVCSIIYNYMYANICMQICTYV